MRYVISRNIVFIIILLGCRISFSQINLINSQTEDIGPGLSIPNLWAQFYGSMNTMIAAQDVILSHKEHQYISFYNAERKVVVARRHLCDRQWEFLVLDDYIQEANDRHNHISMGICPNDGTIHLSFDHHIDTLHYRISVVGLANHPEDYTWEQEIFSEVRNYLIVGQVQPRITYPTFVSTTDGHLNMLFRYRGAGNAESYIAFYNGHSHQWEDVHKFIESTGEYKDPYLDFISYSRNAYPFTFVYDDQGWLHAAWVWRESNASRYNHDINYAKSPDHGRTWHNNEGEVIGRITENDTLYIKYASPGLNVWTIDSRYGMINNGGMALDQNGQPHIMAFHRAKPKVLPTPSFAGYNDGRHHHYWRTPDGSWHKQETWCRGGRPRLFSDSHGNMYMTFIDRTDSLDYLSPYIVRVVVAGADDAWSNWYQLYEGVHHTRKNEPPADPVHIHDQGVMTVVSHEFYDFFLNGPMYITDLYTDIEHTSRVQLDIKKDAYIVRGSGDENFGNSHILVVSDKAGDTLDREVFLQFDLARLSELDVENIISSELIMGTLHGNFGFAGEDYDLYFVDDDSWTEEDITWNNAPQASSYIHTIQGDSLFMRWDITSELKQEWNDDATLSLAIRKTMETGPAEVIFHSKESSAGGLSPKIIVTAESSCLQDIGLLIGIEEGVRELESSRVRVYPNPVLDGKVHISGLDAYLGNDVYLEIVNATGYQVYNRYIQQLGSSKLSINTSIDRPGIYILKISGVQDKYDTCKIVVN